MIKFEQIVNNLKNVKSGEKSLIFVRSFLKAFEFPESTIKRIEIEYSDDTNVIRLHKKILFVFSTQIPLHLEFEKIKETDRNLMIERFIIFYNNSHLLAYDTKLKETIKIPFKELYLYLEFFQPLLGQEKVGAVKINNVDLKSAESFAILYNELISQANFNSFSSKRELDITIARLLLTFWLESLGLFGKGSLKRILFNHSENNGTNTHLLLEKLFSIFKEGSLNSDLLEFKDIPLLRIELFNELIRVPYFTKKAHIKLMELCEVDWTNVNPDILGSLIQRVVDPNDSSGLSNHYTSSMNILKVIAPLFLDQFYNQLDEAANDVQHLNHLLKDISKIKIFDPSCGAGNFLIVSLKEIILLTNEIRSRLEKSGAGNSRSIEKINLNQFYGIEENYFKCLITKIGLCIEYFKGEDATRINISEICLTYNSINIINDNPTIVDWNLICNSSIESTVFIVSNPTYKGARKQTSKQKNDVSHVFHKYKNIKNLDYSSCWLYLAAKYIENNNARCAIVATNSLTQGEHVQLLWPKIFSHNVEIFFAHTSFKWKNSSSGNTGVTVIILGLSKKNEFVEKKLLGNDFIIKTNIISPYLTTGTNIIVSKRNKPISNLPPMPKGNMPYDNGNLILTKGERLELIENNPDSSKFLKKLLGSLEFIQGIERWCIWINDSDLGIAKNIPSIDERIQRVKDFRLNSSDKSANKLAQRPFQFRETNITSTQTIIIPSVSSEKREYIPIDFVDESVIITNLAFAIYDCETWIFGVLTSKMHNLWIRTVCGSLETRIRYSSNLGYNTFPFPNLTNDQKEKITDCVYQIIGEREKYSEKTLSQIYNPDFMPSSLKSCHRTLDLVIEKCYRDDPFLSDQDRIDYLFNLYKKISS